jgi:hypothetical protein
MNNDKGLSGEDVVVMMGDFTAQNFKAQKLPRQAQAALDAPVGSGQPTELTLIETRLLLFPSANHVTAH